MTCVKAPGFNQPGACILIRPWTESAIVKPMIDSPSATAKKHFSFSQARALIADLTQPKPAIYWIDFLLTIITGHAFFFSIVYSLRNLERTAAVWAWVAFAYVGVIFLFMRATMFIHELVHLQRDTMRAFRVVWNLLCGIPFLLPSFLYYPHVDHHRRKHYGTDHDGEYLPLSHSPRWFLIGFALQGFYVPPLAILRFAVISPICWIYPPARTIIHRHASTMVIDPFYQRPAAGMRVQRIIVMQEVLCFLWCWGFLAVNLRAGGVSDPIWPLIYAVGVGAVTINALRTLGAHRWINREGEMTFEEQLLDTLNFPDRPWITELWGPIGTRYHALHHLFPRLPYHSLPAAHRRLMEGLPEDSPYRQTVRTSLTQALRELWNRSTTGPVSRA